MATMRCRTNFVLAREVMPCMVGQRMLAVMAIYYSRLQLITRSRGQSAVAAAAYRCGGKLKDERVGRTHDYRRKGGVLDARMLAPADASWAFDTATLWNQAEKAEVRCNARTARELIVALPAELPQAAQIELAHTIGHDLVDQYRVAVLVAVHAPDKAGDDRNTHAHLLMTTREVRADGLGPKTRVLDDKTTGPAEAERMREHVAARINTALERAGVSTSVDPRPLAVQAQEAAERGDLDAVVRLTRTPTRHQGVAATAAARKGRFSPVVHDNRNVRRDNRSVARHGRTLVNRYRAITRSPVRGPDGISKSQRRLCDRKAGVISASRAASGGHASRTRDPVEQYMQAIQADARQLELSLAEQLRSIRDDAAQYAQLAELWRQRRADVYRDDRTARLLHSSTQTAAADSKHAEPSRSSHAVCSPSARSVAAPTRGLTQRQWAEYRRALRYAGAASIEIDGEFEQRAADTANGRTAESKRVGQGGGGSDPASRLTGRAQPRKSAPSPQLSPEPRPRKKPRFRFR